MMQGALHAAHAPRARCARRRRHDDAAARRGDLLLVSAGPGWFSTVDALVGVAAEAGARTARRSPPSPRGACRARRPRRATCPRRRWPTTSGGTTSLLPMGSLYEAVQLVTYRPRSRCCCATSSARRPRRCAAGTRTSSELRRQWNSASTSSFAIKRWPEPERWAAIVRRASSGSTSSSSRST